MLNRNDLIVSMCYCALSGYPDVKVDTELGLNKVFEQAIRVMFSPVTVHSSQSRYEPSYHGPKGLCIRTFLGR